MLRISSETGKPYHYYYKPRPEYRNRGPSTYNRTCSKCGSTTTRIQPPKGHNRYPTALWLKDGNGGWKCWTCKNRENSLATKGKTLRYENKVTGVKRLINFKKQIRKGICSICNKRTFTILNHIKYNDKLPIANTVEMCRKCHADYHRIETGQFSSLLLTKLIGLQFLSFMNQKDSKEQHKLHFLR